MATIRTCLENENSSGAGLSHDSRPWVFFMIDCFMLIVTFLVLDFKFKVEDAILPQRLPPGVIPPNPYIDCKEKVLPIHVRRNGNTPEYEIYTRACSLPEMNETMAAMVSCGKKFQVRVSYERNVPWGDVIAVFNECAKLNIKECGMVPLRGEPPLFPAPSSGP